MKFNQKRLDYIETRLATMPYGYVEDALEIAREGAPDAISGSLVIAVGLRESGLRNVLGDKGRARGSHQFLDTYHAEFLRSVSGCKAAPTIAAHRLSCWMPVANVTALRPGFCPTWQASCSYCVRVLNALYNQAVSDGVPEKDRLQVALAAYNVGYTRALTGYAEPLRRWTAAMRSALHPGEPTGLPADRYTTRGNYAADVLQRRSEVNHLFARRLTG
jgi:hypothetical protein